MLLFEELKNKLLDNSKFLTILEKNNIELLRGFSDNTEYIYKFYNKFYSVEFPKIVLCGINPGKNGAGKTGIPFIDFNSLSKIFSEIERIDSERSAKFIFKLIDFMGIENFFKNYYLTNFSFLGFIKDKNNINYYELPPEAVDIICECFIYEMEIIKPEYIISLSKDVFHSVNLIFCGTNINVNYHLPHPYYCSFPRREEKYLHEYVTLLNSILKTE